MRSARFQHGFFLVVFFAALAGVGFWIPGWLPPHGSRAWESALATHLPHATMGWLLWKRNFGSQDGGIASAIGIMAIRFPIGAASFVTGFVNCAESWKLFVLLWTGFFLILQASEAFFFVQGAKEL